MAKKAEGNEEQRRTAARGAREQGTSPSKLGAAKPRAHETDAAHPKDKDDAPSRPQTPPSAADD